MHNRFDVRFMKKALITDIGNVRFFYRQVRFPLLHRTLLKQYLLTLFIQEKRTVGSLAFIFCTDDFLLDINNQYLKHNFYTDIITFDLSIPDSPLIGEMYISIDRIRENAATYNISFSCELHRVIFHGALHLCGYKDKTSKDSLLMRTKEDTYLKNYFK